MVRCMDGGVTTWDSWVWGISKGRRRSHLWSPPSLALRWCTWPLRGTTRPPSPCLDSCSPGAQTNMASWVTLQKRIQSWGVLWQYCRESKRYVQSEYRCLSEVLWFNRLECQTECMKSQECVTLMTFVSHSCAFTWVIGLYVWPNFTPAPLWCLTLLCRNK